MDPEKAVVSPGMELFPVVDDDAREEPEIDGALLLYREAAICKDEGRGGGCCSCTTALFVAAPVCLC